METRPLSADEHDALASGLALAAAMAGGTRPLGAAEVQELYDGLAGKEALAEARSVVGLAFGELVLGLGPFEWVRKTDAHGAETCLAARGLELFCYPISMIEQRLADGEAVEIEMLARQTALELKKLIAAGGCASR